MSNREKTTYDFYQLAGSRVKTPAFSWPVYDCRLMDLEQYLDRPNLDRNGLFKDELFAECLDNLESRKLIVPIYSKIPSKYEPLKKVTNLAAAFAQLDKNPLTGEPDKYLSDDAIGSWVVKFGLPTYIPLTFSTHRLAADGITEMPWQGISVGDMFKRWSYIESRLSAFSRGNYVMLYDTFLGLQKVSSGLFEAIHAFLEDDIRKSVDALLVILPLHLSESLMSNRQAVKRGKVSLDVKFELIFALSNMLSSLLTGVTLNVGIDIDKGRYIPIQTWQVDSLWSAMILQFYNYLALNQPFKECPACHRYFSMSGQRKDRAFCPVGTGLYQDCKQHYKDVNRRKP